MKCRAQAKIFSILWLFLFFSITIYSREKEPVGILFQQGSPRISFGVQKLVESLRNAGYRVITLEKIYDVPGKNFLVIIAGELNWDPLKTFGESLDEKPGKEGYTIASNKTRILVGGADDSGVLYGCLALIDKIKETGKLPLDIFISDQPEMVLRGQCIGLQKSTYLPGRGVYEYPYTPETFPWFYDKKLWIRVLDSMLENRMNSLYLWNGHPFASLVRLKDYPYAVEVSEETFKRNEEIYYFLTTEADKRGIWVIQMFYNIIVSKPFAEHYKIKTQDRDRPIIPLIADYTRKSIAAFVEKYPNVGLMVCLGEAMEGTGNDDIEWFTKTIIPGVKDGLSALGLKGEVPIVLRAHDTDAPAVMKAALPLYKNLYTEAKFNGEALTFPRPRSAWAELHQQLSHLGSVQIENVHIMANLEPFRYGSPDFIQQCVIGMHEVMGGNGLHLYPQASYWDWPFSADSVKARPDDTVGRGKRLLQIERDWIWYKAWGRYAWKAKRDRKDEINYWAALLASRYGCPLEQGKNILEAYEQSGQIAPKLLRRFGITDGNRQTLTLGMLMTQLINPTRYGLFTLLYESESPEGEMLGQYVEREWNHQSHFGETPLQVIQEVEQHGSKAVEAIMKAAPTVTKNKREFARLRNDMDCYQALADHYAAKASAAMLVLRYKYSNDLRDLEVALTDLQFSIEYYKKLAELTRDSYRYANSMQTQQRKIPMRGVDGTYKTWKEVLVPFDNEMNHFARAIDSLKRSAGKLPRETFSYSNVKEALPQPVDDRYIIDSATNVYSDTSGQIVKYAKELKGVTGIKMSFRKQVRKGTLYQFTSSRPVKVLVGFFESADPVFLKPPELETNAYANDRGQAETMIAHGIVIKGMPPVNIHSYDFGSGANTLILPKGACLVLGIIDGATKLKPYDAGLTEKETSKELDWLFE